MWADLGISYNILGPLSNNINEHLWEDGIDTGI